MPTQIEWRRSSLVSVLHAAEAAGRNQPLIDPRLAEILRQPATELAAEIRAAGLPADRFWRHLIPLAANLDNRRQLLDAAVTKTVGRGGRFEGIVAVLAARLAAVDLAYRAAVPASDDEVELRQRPIREQWEARGPGMLYQIGLLTDEALVPANCDVLFVQPVLGGAGEAHLQYNSVRMEAVLANPVSELPEIVRLAWLIAQLQLDLPVYSESIHADRLPHIARFAMLPASLAAAEAVELSRFTREAISQAVGGWHVAVPPGVDAVAIVQDWWGTYQATRPSWGVAMQALDRMFG